MRPKNRTHWILLSLFILTGLGTAINLCVSVWASFQPKPVRVGFELWDIIWYPSLGCTIVFFQLFVCILIAEQFRFGKYPIDKDTREVLWAIWIFIGPLCTIFIMALAILIGKVCAIG